MSLAYYKRFRMEVDLQRIPSIPFLPHPYRFVPWGPSELVHHAQVKFNCFRDELDSRIFPCLGDKNGCIRLMRDISSRGGFVPAATWLVACKDDYLGTVQGVIDRTGVGMIQNLGVVPEARNMGIGSALLLRALHGFRSAGMRVGMLEVTAENAGAVRLYRRLGFRRARTLYKAVNDIHFSPHGDDNSDDFDF